MAAIPCISRYDSHLIRVPPMVWGPSPARGPQTTLAELPMTTEAVSRLGRQGKLVSVGGQPGCLPGAIADAPEAGAS
jgi:hypothetical protein